MTSHRIDLRRGDLLLGSMETTEIPDLLHEGFLEVTDKFKAPGSWRWRPLTDLERYLADSQSGIASRLLLTATDVVGTVRDSATSAAESISEATGKAFRTATATPNQLLESWLPKIAALTDRALAGMSGSIQTYLTDEPFLRKLFGAVYDSLPKPVHRFVAEEQFIAFCLKHREHLVKKSPLENTQPIA